MSQSTTSAFAVALLVSACATNPSGPSAMALPGTGKNFEQFQYDDGYCRQYSSAQVNGTTANQAANESVAKSAVAGTAIGAVLGAAAGGHEGAGVGAATGLLFGTLTGASAGQYSSYSLQQRYDNAYVQCMYAKGNKVPVSGRLISSSPQGQGRYSSPPPGYYPPPPPPGYVR